MTTHKRFRNKFRLEMRERDHNPAHVHLTGAGFDVMIDLQTLQTVGTWPADLRDEVMAFVAAHQGALLSELEKWH